MTSCSHEGRSNTRRPGRFARLRERTALAQGATLACSAGTSLPGRSSKREAGRESQAGSEVQAESGLVPGRARRRLRRQARGPIARDRSQGSRLDDLIAGAKANEVSLAVFKPTRILDFICEEATRDWDPDKVREMRELTNQLDLFADNSWRETFTIIPKLPYSFSYRFEDAAGRVSEQQILDWEAGALYWNCLRSTNGDEPQALAKVRQKYLDSFLKTDLHFFLGTTQQFHFVAPNPWVIVGVFPIPHKRQLGLF